MDKPTWIKRFNPDRGVEGRDEIFLEELTFEQALDLWDVAWRVGDKVLASEVLSFLNNREREGKVLLPANAPIVTNLSPAVRRFLRLLGVYHQKE